MRQLVVYIMFFLAVFFIFKTANAQQKAVFQLPVGCSSDDYISGQIIVKFKADVAERERSEICRALLKEIRAEKIVQKYPKSFVPIQRFNSFGQSYVDISRIYEIFYDKNISIEEAINKSEKSSLFEYVCPHYIDKLLYVPNDPNLINQYYLNNIKAFQAWDICKSDTNKVVAITDTGIELNHPDLVGNIKYNYNDTIDGIDNDNDGFVDNFRGWNTANNNNNVQWTTIAHGVHVSGIAGASVDNGFGIAGVGFKNKILPVKVDNNFGGLIATYEAIVYAADHGANVINCSWGSPYAKTQYGQDIIDYASINRNALVVAACGNENNDKFYYPASYHYVLSVANTNNLDVKYDNSSYGYNVDMSAPGTSIYSTWMGASFLSSIGTSMAAPIVAGAANIVASHYPELNMLQVAERLRTTTDLIDTLVGNENFKRKLGTGRLNIYKAITEPFTPSLRVINCQFTDSANMKFDPNEIIYINVNVINYLANSSANCRAILECISPDVQLIDSVWEIGVVNTMQNVNNFSKPFKVKLLNVAPSSNIKFKIHFYNDTNYLYYDYASMNVNKDYATIDTNALTLTITSYGNFAFNNILQQTQGEGFRLNNGQNLVSAFGFLCGNDPLYVADNIYSIVNPLDSDFVAETFVTNIVPAPYGDKCFNSKYNDKGICSRSKLGVKISQMTYAWNTPEDKNYIIAKYTIKNDTTHLFENFHAALYADWDIAISSQNRCKYNPSLDLLIAYSIDSSVFVATGLLTKVPSTHYAMDINGFNSSISIADGFSDAEKYSMMRTTRVSAGDEIKGNDIAASVAAGPFSIEPEDSIEISFVIIAGRNLDEIKKAKKRAEEKFNNPNESVCEYRGNDVAVFPNPANDLLNYELKNTSKLLSIYIFDINGKNICKLNNQSSKGVLDISFLPEGIYSISFSYSGFSFSKTFTINR